MKIILPAINETCEYCKYWNVKSEVAVPKYSGKGMCDSPKNGVKLSLNKEHLKRFLIEPKDAESIINSIRYPHNFGCKYFKKND